MPSRLDTTAPTRGPDPATRRRLAPSRSPAPAAPVEDDEFGAGIVDEAAATTTLAGHDCRCVSNSRSGGGESVTPNPVQPVSR